MKKPNKPQAEEQMQEVVLIDADRVADDIMKLPRASIPPFLSGIMISGLMLMDPALEPYIAKLKAENLHLDNFEIMCLFFYRVPQLADQFLEQTAEHARQGVYPEGEGQLGWNEKEFEIAINLLGLTLK